MNNLPPQLRDKKTPFAEKAQKFIKFYIAPILTLAVFFAILIFLIFPKISEIFGNIDTIAKNNAEIVKRNNELGQLSTMYNRFTEIEKELKLVNEIAPSGTTEVISFRDKITKLATQNGLTVTSQSLSETDIGENGTITAPTDGSVLTLQSIPTAFSISGRYEDIINFINDLNTIPDFVVIRQMDFIVKDRSNPDAKPRTEIRFDKYLFNILTAQAAFERYVGVSPTAWPSETFLKYINRRQVTTESQSTETDTDTTTESVDNTNESN